jgi:signal peptidase II
MSKYRLHLIAGALVLLDQVTKLAVKGFSLFGITHEGMYLGQSTPLLGDVVRLTYVENAGSAFGLEWGSAKVFLTIATLLITGGLFWYLTRIATSSIWLRIAVMLLLAGAAGNVIDRTFYGLFFNEAGLFLGSVVDFVQVDIPDVTIFGQHWTHWPVFNVADSCVSVGIVLMLFVGGKPAKPTTTESDAAPDSGEEHATGTD